MLFSSRKTEAIHNDKKPIKTHTYKDNQNRRNQRTTRTNTKHEHAISTNKTGPNMERPTPKPKQKTKPQPTPRPRSTQVAIASMVRRPRAPPTGRVIPNTRREQVIATRYMQRRMEPYMRLFYFYIICSSDAHFARLPE